MTHEQTPDVLIGGGRVVTMNAAREVFADGAVAIAGERIVAVGRDAELRAMWPEVPVHDARCVVMSGMVNAISTSPATCSPAACLTTGARRSIFSWSVLLHGAPPATTSFAHAHRRSGENGVTTSIEAGTTPTPIVPRDPAAGGRGTVGPWGWDVDGAVHRLVDETSTGSARCSIASRRRAGRRWVTLVGYNLAPHELLVAADRLAREGANSPCTSRRSRRTPKVPATTGRRPVATPPASASSAGTCCSLSRPGSPTRFERCSTPMRPSPTARGRTCGWGRACATPPRRDPTRGASRRVRCQQRRRRDRDPAPARSQPGWPRTHIDGVGSVPR